MRLFFAKKLSLEVTFRIERFDSHKNETKVNMEETSECFKNVREDINSMRTEIRSEINNKVWYSNKAIKYDKINAHLVFIR